MLTPILIAAAVGYLLGSLPFGYLVARAKGVNIFEVGSKNPGATNVRRVLGRGAGNVVFILDVLKGSVGAGWPLAYCLLVDAEGEFCGNGLYGAYILGVAGLVGALLGHSFSCFTKFRGGKGVATAAGGLLVLMPLAVLAAAVVWVVTFYASRYVSLASIFAAIAVPVAAWLLKSPGFLIGIAAAIAVFVVIRHRANIQRLMAGTESKFVKKMKDAPK